MAPVVYKGSVPDSAPSGRVPAWNGEAAAPSMRTAPKPVVTSVSPKAGQPEPAERQPVSVAKLAPVSTAPVTVAQPAASVTTSRKTAIGYIITVLPGDTLSGLARRNEISPLALAEANDLELSDKLLIGQKLVVPKARTHTVAAGDTIYRIAKRYDVPAERLVWANGMTAPYRINLGDKLVIPSDAAPPVRVATVNSVADTRKPVATARPTAVKSGRATVRRQPVPGPKPKRQTVKLSGPAPRTFSWPLHGRILAGYGAKTGGLYNDGINIAAQPGQQVKAAADGVVTYAGRELKGFGNLLLVKHAGGWTTAYAHNARLLVAKGATVRRGQVVALAGASGNVTRPQLHFEIRRGIDAVDPMRMLGKSRQIAQR